MLKHYKKQFITRSTTDFRNEDMPLQSRQSPILICKFNDRMTPCHLSESLLCSLEHRALFTMGNYKSHSCRATN